MRQSRTNTSSVSDGLA